MSVSATDEGAERLAKQCEAY